MIQHEIQLLIIISFGTPCSDVELNFMYIYIHRMTFGEIKKKQVL